MAFKHLALLVVLCATVLALSSPTQARELLVDRVVSKCKEYGKLTDIRSHNSGSGLD